MTGIFFLLIAGIVLAAFFWARSRSGGARPAAPPSEPGVRDAKRLAEFKAWVEKETGEKIDLPTTNLSSPLEALLAFEAAAKRPAAVPSKAPSQPQRRPAERTAKAAPKRPPRHQTPFRPAAPQALPPLQALAARPPLKRQRARPALEPMVPSSPLAPRAVRSP